MRESMQQVKDLLRARIQCIWIDTYEEADAIKDLKEIVAEMTGINLLVWSHTEGLKKVPLTSLERVDPPDLQMTNPPKLFSHIQSMQSNADAKTENVFVLRDLHLLNDTHTIKRGIRDLKEYPSKNYNPIIVLSPVMNIPAEHEKLFTIVTYDVPSKAEIRGHVDAVSRRIDEGIKRGQDYIASSEEDKRKIINACVGLTFNQISDVFAKSVIQHRGLSIQAVMEEKIQLVKKSGVLDYVIPKFTFDDIGGNRAFKEWILEVEDSMTEEAAEFGVPRPKGYLALGIPGSSKTVSAESIANKWGYPLLKLDMSKIMDKLVGQSEQKIDQAFRVAKASAPAVLLIDEVEKALGGIGSSNSSDGGTTARVFGKVLEFLNEEDTGVFTVMTSNDVSQLPPELTRSGRLDAMWYFSLPTREEREEIFRIHIKRIGKGCTDELIDDAVEVSNNYTGAEIAEVVKIAARKAYRRFKEDNNKELTSEDIKAAATEVIPLYRSSKEKIMALEAWANGRARSTNHLNISSIEESNDDQLLGDILQLER